MNDWLDAEGHADRAYEMYERGRWAEAENELRKALSLNPDQPEWHFNLGLTLEAAGRETEALGCYERAVELMPSGAEPRVAAAALANRLSRYREAITWIDEALRIEPRLDAAYAHKMESHYRLGDHDEAEMTYYLAQQMLEEPSAPCLAVMAESLYERGDYERCGWCLREALRLDPNLPRLRARLGTVYAATGRPQRALQMFLRDLRDDPGNIDTLLDYGDLLIDLGRLREASEKFRRVLELEPANVDAHHRLGQIAMSARRFEQAHLEFELVLKLDQDYPEIRLALAEALLHRGRLEAARGCLQEERSRWREQGGDIDLASLGTLLLDAGLPREAEGVLAAAVEGDATNADLLRKQALARFQSGEIDGGAALSRRVLRLDPRCIVSMHNLALSALRRGRVRQAGGWVRRGLRIDRHDEEMRRLRVRVWLAWTGQAVRRLLGLRPA